MTSNMPIALAHPTTGTLGDLATSAGTTIDSGRLIGVLVNRTEKKVKANINAAKLVHEEAKKKHEAALQAVKTEMERLGKALSAPAGEFLRGMADGFGLKVTEASILVSAGDANTNCGIVLTLSYTFKGHNVARISVNGGPLVKEAIADKGLAAAFKARKAAAKVMEATQADLAAASANLGKLPQMKQDLEDELLTLTLKKTAGGGDLLKLLEAGVARAVESLGLPAGD